MIMKTKLSLLLTILLISGLFQINAKAQSSSTERELPVMGFVTAEGKKSKEATVKIYEGNTLWKDIEADKKGYFEIGLELNKHYTFEFMTEGMLTKRLAINTMVEKKTAKPIPFECYIDLVPLEKFNGADVSTLDFPIAIVQYNAKKRAFEPSLQYTMNMLKEYDKLTVSAE